MSASPPSRAAVALARWVGACCDRAWAVVAVIVVLAVCATAYVATHFAMTSKTDQLLSAHLPYRIREAAFSDLFQPEGDQTVVVIDGRTPEIAEDASARLAAKMQSRPDLFREVQRPEAGFFAQEGLLYEPVAQVREQMNQLIAAQPFLGPLAADPSLRGLMETLGTALQGAGAGQARLAQLQRPISSLAQTLGDVKVRSHTFRFVWPAQTDALKIPNACNLCHADKTTAWATAALRSWSDRSPWRSQ